jgi:DNA-binding GntR family transcriptional regulator
MSMAPVGEAFRELSRDGLLEMEPGWGARVRRLDAESLRNQHILRTAIECEAARQCATRATDAQIDALADVAAELDDLIDSGGLTAPIFELDSRFHRRVAQLSGVASLAETLRTNQLVRMLARGSMITRGLKRPARQHTKLVAAIRTRDPDQAEQAMREHCLRSMELQLAYLACDDGGEQSHG